MDDEDVGDVSSAKISTTNSSDDREHSGSEPYADEVVRVMRLAVDDPMQVMLSAVKKLKKQREQREARIPPPWIGLNAAPDDIKQCEYEL